MVEARNCVLISFPFAAGVALAQFSGFSLFHISLALVAGLVLPALGGRLNRRFWYGVMFFAVGMLCGAASLAASPAITKNGLPGVDTAAGSLLRRALTHTGAIIRDLPFPHERTNALLRALLTGQRDGLGRETTAAFRAAGASHILALSGLHLGIIYLLVSKLLLPVGNGRISAVIRSVLVVAVAAFYTFMTGASPSTVRALLFITLNETLKHCPWRRKSPIAVWCCALMIQLTFSPWAIRSAGFQLSYLAMLGIFTLYPRLDAIYPKPQKGRDPLRWMWSSMALSISCQAFTAPLVWILFKSFPVHFLLTNLLALPLTTVLMFCAVALLLSGFAGICPSWLILTTDTLAELLQACLEIISGM
jgi:competence protein ComEC